MAYRRSLDLPDEVVDHAVQDTHQTEREITTPMGSRGSRTDDVVQSPRNRSNRVVWDQEPQVRLGTDRKILSPSRQAMSTCAAGSVVRRISG